MIDLIPRSPGPSYKGTQPTSKNRPGLLAGLWCYLFGGGSATPAYRDQRAASGAPSTVTTAAPRCWWSFAGSPQYKAPPEPLATVPEADVPDDGATEPAACPCEPDIEGRVLVFADE